MDLGALAWLTPTLAALVLWGLAQGLVKKYVGEVPPARFCLYYAVANGVVNTLFWVSSPGRPALFAPEHLEFLRFGLLAYVLDGAAWILYYESIVSGPISIVGTLSAAYPAVTVLLARAFLDERLTSAQYAGVVAIILGCLALAYSPTSERAATRPRWIPLAGTAVLMWGISGTLTRHAYQHPGSSEANMALFVAAGGLATLGVYGFVKSRRHAGGEGGWRRSAFPMVTMALGSLAAAIAYKSGPASIVTPLSGAYPVVTVAFAAAVLRERPSRLQWAGIVAILAGMVSTTAAS